MKKLHRPYKTTLEKLDRLTALLQGKGELLIVMQDSPDPDALASAAALKELAHRIGAIHCSIAYGGVVGRAENRALLKYLRLNPHLFSEIDMTRFELVALVDTQPGMGNNSLPPAVIPNIVIDHHPILPATRCVEFTDIRSDYGATSTIMYQYLRMSDIEPDIHLSTALLYGIRSDTQDLGRDSIKADIEAYLDLYPVANKRVLSQISVSKTPRSYFHMLMLGLANATLHGSCIVSNLGKISIPDMIGEVADLLLRDEECECTLCYGYFNDVMLLSMRTSDPDLDTGHIMSQIVEGIGTGGGHKMMAGGQIPARSATDLKHLQAVVVERFLTIMHAPAEKEPLILSTKQSVSAK